MLAPQPVATSRTAAVAVRADDPLPMRCILTRGVPVSIARVLPVKKRFSVKKRFGSDLSLAVHPA